MGRSFRNRYGLPMAGSQLPRSGLVGPGDVAGALAAMLEDMVSGPALFAAAGVTGGDLLPAPLPHGYGVARPAT